MHELLKDATADQNYESYFPNSWLEVNKKSENTVEANINLVEDFGNYKLISATNDNIQIKVKVKRESVIPEDKIFLEIPSKHCCIYNNEELVE